MLSLTEKELNAPGGMSTIDGGYMSGYNPSLPTPTTPQPQPTTSTPVDVPVTDVTTPVPTIGETLGTIKNEALRIQDILNQRSDTTDFSTSQFEAGPEYTPFDEEKARRDATRNQMKLYQAEIDATNQVYDQLLNEARIQGQGRLGSQRAIAARGGLLGSDFAGAQKEKVQSYNTDIERGIGAERTAAIGSIMGNVRQAALDEVKAKREARAAGAEEYLKYLSGKSERKTNYLNTLVSDMLTQGYDISQFTEDELNQFGKEAGLSANDIIAAYKQAEATQLAASTATDLETRKTEAEISKIEADIASGKVIKLPEGNMLYNIETGETFLNPKTYKPESTSGGGSTFSSSDQQTLLAGGWTEADMASIDADVKANGLPAVIENARANGATDSQIKALQDTYGAEADDTNKFLTKDYLRSLFGDDALKKSAKEAGVVTGGEDFIPFNERGDVESYLNTLEKTIELYRQAGYTDQQILKQMQ